MLASGNTIRCGLTCLRAAACLLARLLDHGSGLGPARWEDQEPPLGGSWAHWP